jgi:hypothetical protein
MNMILRWLLCAPPEPELRKIEVFDWTEIQIKLLEADRRERR